MGWGQSGGGAKGSGLRAAGTAALIMFCQTFLNKYRLKQLIDLLCMCVCFCVCICPICMQEPAVAGRGVRSPWN